MKVLIVGAGMGGLALAAYLHTDGHDVTVIEKKKDGKQRGFVLGLWSNGLHTLAPFDVLDRIRQESMLLSQEFIRDKTGALLARIDYNQFTEQYGEVYLLPHTALHAILRTLVTDVPIYFETTISTLEEQPQGVLVTYGDGTRHTYDLVIGADGIHSQVRQILFDDEGFSYSGLSLWLSMLPPLGKKMPTEPNDLFGEGEYVGIFPTKSKQTGVLFLAKMPDEVSDLPEQRIPYLRERFADFGWIVPDILQALHDPRAIFYDTVDQVSLETWHKGRVVLLGDAAHAVSPTAALGGAMALEDAHVLTEELRYADAAHYEQALAQYEQRRRPRVEETRHTSDFLIWLASLDSPVVTFARGVIMHLIPSSYLLKGMEPMMKNMA